MLENIEVGKKSIKMLTYILSLLDHGRVEQLPIREDIDCLPLLCKARRPHAGANGNESSQRDTAKKHRHGRHHSGYQFYARISERSSKSIGMKHFGKESNEGCYFETNKTCLSSE